VIDQAENREATATIRGYLYQFDATIRTILSLNNHDTLTVEGLEDFDVQQSDLSGLFQCKYYAAQRLTSATIRDAILPMLKGFISLDLPSRNKRHYHLYGYFKDSCPSEKKLTSVDLKRILVRKERVILQSGQAENKIIDVMKEIGAKENDIRLFVQQFTIHICTEYDEHKNNVVEALKKAFRVTLVEAEGYLYPTALTLVSVLATKPNKEDREISKEFFLQQIQPSHAIYNAWALREKGESAYCSNIRRKYFTSQNVDNEHRFFIIETLSESMDADFLELLKIFQRKWSSHRVRRKPDNERYAPYVHFRNMPPDRLIKIKHLLYKEGARFVDGYAFYGAQFCAEHLCKQQTYENQISLRLVNSQDDLIKCIEVMNQPYSIYEFFVDTRMNVFTTFQRVVAIPITSLRMITQIV